MSNERPVYGRGEAASEALVSATLALFSRWLDSGERADLLVALDGLSEMNVRFSSHDQNAFQHLAATPRRVPRRERARALAPIVWNLVHQLPDQWRPSSHELRMLLALALQVRQQIHDRQWIVGGERGYINLTGLSWWAGLREERTFPRIATIGRFVEDGDVEAFRRNLLNDEANEAQRRQRNASRRSRRERQRQLRVFDYESGRLLEGLPSMRLVRECETAPSGAVPAYRDSNYQWWYVTPQNADHFRHVLREDVITVYVA